MRAENSSVFFVYFLYRRLIQEIEVSSINFKISPTLPVGVGTLFDGEPEFRVFGAPNVLVSEIGLSGLIRALRLLL